VSRTLVVDRIEGRIAVLIDDDGPAFDVPLRSLPQGTREGSVLRVPEKGGSPDWTSAVLDEKARVEREEEGKRILEELKRRDPGGDVKL
jgi:hypothetical protein